MATPGRIWAIASITLLEASRRRVFTILILFAVVLLSSVTFLPAVEMSGRLRLIEAWSLRATSLFAAVVALFMAGFSLPSDFEQKRIYLLVTRPVSKVTIFAGKFAGFLLLLVLFIGSMGIITLSFIRIVQWGAGETFPALVAYPRVQASEFAPENARASKKDAGRFSIEGDDENALVWRFRGLSPSRFPERVRVIARFEVYAPADLFRASGNVRFIARSGGRDWKGGQFMQTNEDLEFMLPAGFLAPDGALDLTVKRGDPDGGIAARALSLQILGRSDSFELNFARGLLLSLLQASLLLAITLMGSTFLSATVSILLGIVLFGVGMTHSYVMEGTRDIEDTLRHEEETRAGHEDHPEERRTPENLPEWLLRSATAGSRLVLKAVPDFEQFDFSRWLLKDRAVAWSEVGSASLHALPGLVVMIGVGMLAIFRKDLG